MEKIAATRPTITRKEIEGVLNCLIKEELLQGDSIADFENGISNLLALKYSLATSSLLAAYHLAFEALNIYDDDEVIIPSYFDIAPLSALNLTGGKAVLTDVNDNSLFPSIDQIKEKISGKTKAIVVGHLFGFHSPIEEFKELNIPIIEDISHIIGAGANGTSIGSVGTISVASFAPSMMITTGNGGIVLTNHLKLYNIMKEKRDNTNSNNISYDYCLTDFQGAMGISQLSKLTNFIKRRREIAKRYFSSLRMTSHKTPFQYSDSFVYHSFPIIFDAPTDKIKKYWRKSGIDMKRPITNPLHNYLNLRAMDFPQSERLAKKLYTLPIYPTLTKNEIEKISTTLAKFV